MAPHELPSPIHGRMLVLSCVGLLQVPGCCEFVNTTAMSCPEGILGMNSSHALTLTYYLPHFLGYLLQLEGSGIALSLRAEDSAAVYSQHFD